jgi:hypothetical protein
MSNEYYVICDSNQSIIAIHRVYDSAVACYEHFVKRGFSDSGVSIIVFRTNQYGIVISENIAKSYSAKPKLTVS